MTIVETKKKREKVLAALQAADKQKNGLGTKSER